MIPSRCEVLWANKSLRVTFDPPPIFAAAEAVIASYTPQLRR